MGGILSLGSVACCVGSSALSAGCSLCSSCTRRSSALTKVMYAGTLLLTLVLSCVMLAPGVQNWLTKVPFCEENDGSSMLSNLPGYIVREGIKVKCADAIGYLAVYRVCFIVTLFFMLMSVVMIGVKSSRDPRAELQNSYWGLKYLVLIGGIIGAFFIPHGSFGPTWMYFGLLGGLAFILVQLVLIVDFAHSWAENWNDQRIRNNNDNWFYALLACTFFFFALALSVIIFSYSYYTGMHVGQCKLHEFFITFNMLLCIILSVASVLPKIQEHQPNSGLLQASFVSLYIMYLTWSALTNQPDHMCNANLMEIITGNSTNKYDFVAAKPDVNQQPSMDTASIFGLVLWFLCVLYSSIKSSSNSQAARLTMSDKVVLTDAEANQGETESTQETSESGDESTGVNYNWSLFHLMFALATLYVMMTLTNWYAPGSNLSIESINANMSAVWIKIISAWCCFTIYMWTLVAPVVLPDRDFSV